MRVNGHSQVVFSDIFLYNIQCTLLMRTWRNWYTRSLEEAVPQGVEVQLLSSAQLFKTNNSKYELDGYSHNRFQKETEKFHHRFMANNI
jgi:hypothetical protein